MRHFDHLTDGERERLFQVPPEPFDRADDPGLVGVGLGATLYSPATRPRLADDIVRQAADGLASVVICLEDAVSDDDVESAERNLVAQLRTLRAPETRSSPLPMIFVRVRAPEQIPLVVGGLGPHADLLTGFVLPKFGERDGSAELDAVADASATLGRRLLAMPVLETADIAHAESRVDALVAARRLLDKYRDHVPAVRVGATDLSGTYGLRRPREFTVWDVRVVADVLAAVVNVFGREDAYVIAGPVWEYFSASERVFKPQLREAPFAEARSLRGRLLARELDGLIREVLLDRANGLTGKTVIHPSHVAPVHALSVVPAEEWADACDVLAADGRGGAAASSFGNKMNESKPHIRWAAAVRRRARVFGVAHPDTSFVDLLGAGTGR